MAERASPHSQPSNSKTVLIWFVFLLWRHDLYTISYNFLEIEWDRLFYEYENVPCEAMGCRDNTFLGGDCSGAHWVNVSSVGVRPGQ